MDSLLGKLRYMSEPVSAAVGSKVRRALKPAELPARKYLDPLVQGGREKIKTLTHEGVIDRKAASIERFKERFDADIVGGRDLLVRSLTLIEEASTAASSRETGTRQAEMAEAYHDIHGWMRGAPDPGHTGRVDLESFRSVTQDIMAGYLFHRNEQLFAGEGKKFDREKAKRQVRGVASMLIGHHTHMGTGDGKSSTVLPIVALVESRTSAQREVILSTANDQSLIELRGHLQRLGRELPEQVQCRTEQYEFELNQLGEDKRAVEDIRRNMQREAVLDGSYSAGLKERMRDLYWNDRMKSDMTPSRADMLDSKTEERRIVLAAERDLVFAYEDDPARFIRKVPTVLMDEADIPYRRQTPYVTTSEAQYYSPDEITESMGLWLMHYVVHKNLRYPTAVDAGDFVPTQDGFKLTDEAQVRINKLDLRRLADHPGNKGASARAFDEGIREIASSIGIAREEDIRRLESSMRKWFRMNLPSSRLEPQEEGVQVPEDERLTEMQHTVTAIAERLGSQFFQRGVGFIMDETGEEKVRDAYIDDLLEGHKHEAIVSTAIRAMSGKYKFVPPYRTAGRSVHFQTFAADLGAKLRCASGSLLFPDLMSGKIRKEAFAEFLEQATGNKVVLISPPDIKKAPAPKFFETQGQAMDQLVNGVSEKQQPRLVICYDRLEGEVLFDKFSARNPDKRIVYMPIHPSAEEVSRHCRDLAEGRIDVLISAGNLGFGVNIVKADGEFPDLHVSLYGLPENQLQIVQALGRRRREGSDFSWFMSRPTVYRYIADFKGETTWREQFIQGYLSVDQMLKGYEEVLDDPAKGLPFVTDLLHQHEIQRMTDDIFVTHFDRSMERVRRYAGGYLKDLIVGDIKGKIRKREYLRKEDRILHALKTQAAGMSEFFEGPYPKTANPKTMEIERQVAWMERNIQTLISQYGIPDTLNEYARQELAVAGGSLQANNMRDLVENKLIVHLLGHSHNGAKSRIEQYVEEWFAMRKGDMGEMNRVLSDEYRLRRMFPVMLKPAARDIVEQAAEEGREPDEQAAQQAAAQLEAYLPQVFTPVKIRTLLPSGMELGTIRTDEGNVLALKQDGQIYTINSFQKEHGGFTWDVGAIDNLVGMNYLCSPIGKEESGKKDIYYMWSSIV